MIKTKDQKVLRGNFSYSNHFLQEPKQNTAVRKGTHYYHYKIQNIQFILNHFPDPVFPRTISTQKTQGKQIIINDIHQIYNKFRESDFVDCRINAFPAINKVVPNFIFIDLDDDPHHNKQSLDEILKLTLENIKKRLDGTPTVLWTGSGYHIYQPLYCPSSLNDIEDFNGFDNTDNRFLRFEKDYLSDGNADKSNHPSIVSCMLRSPGTINSKHIDKKLNYNKSRAEVKIIQKWDGVRPSIRNQLGTFYSYLVTKKLDEERQRSSRYFSKNIVCSKIDWIESLLQIGLDDNRKYCIWRILVPYLANIKNLPEPEIYYILEQWLEKCGMKRKLDFNHKVTIRSDLKRVRNFKPISLNSLKSENSILYYRLMDKY